MPAVSWRPLARLADAPENLSGGSSRNPFLQTAFLGALEDSGAVGKGSAWQPCHLLFSRDDQPCALLPLYRKQDSRGEYVFDHSWAAAYQRHGLDYYPKLVSAIPFTPVPGPRLLLAPGEVLADWLPLVLDAVRDMAGQDNASGWHGLFVQEDWLAAGAQAGFARREGCRFHWHNPGYRDFEDFLARLTSKKRKDLRRERRLLDQAGIRCRQLVATAISESDWDFFYRCYERTYHEHGQMPYLGRDFFRLLAQRMPEQLLLVMAEDDSGPLASALFFHDQHTLYGRYWGCLRRADGLHFEVCYYQGMEFCMRQGLSDFDPGTQGEHKLLRGFAPQTTWSLHWLAEPGFQQAIQRFVAEESEGVARYQDQARAVLPYRQES